MWVRHKLHIVYNCRLAKLIFVHVTDLRHKLTHFMVHIHIQMHVDSVLELPVLKVSIFICRLEGSFRSLQYSYYVSKYGIL